MAILSALLTSCSFMNIKGSFDDANQKEGGPSGNKPSAAVGGNIGIEWMWGFSSDGYKRFDAGLNLEPGYRLSNSLQFTLRYEFGLADLSTDPSDYTSRNRSFSINVGYSIKKIIGAFKFK